MMTVLDLKEAVGLNISKSKSWKSLGLDCSRVKRTDEGEVDADGEKRKERKFRPKPKE